jgi:hypothetical protein
MRILEKKNSKYSYNLRKSIHSNCNIVIFYYFYRNSIFYKIFENLSEITQ